MSETLPFLRRLVSGEAPLPAIARTLGFRICAVDVGEARLELDADLERHGNPLGHVHGGVLADLADAAMGMACASTLAAGHSFITIELKMSFMSVVRAGRLRAVGRVVRSGRTITHVECDILDAADALVARASSSCLCQPIRAPGARES